MGTVPAARDGVTLPATTAAVVFDLGNTLVDYPLATEAEQLAFLETFLLDCADQGLIAVGPDDITKELLSSLNAERDDCRVIPFAERLLARWPSMAVAGAAEVENRLVKAIAARGRLAERSIEVLARLRERGLRLGIATNTPWGTPAMAWRSVVRDLDLECDVVLGCGDVGERKPRPALIAACCEALGVAPAHTVVVGDSLHHDVAAALAAGCAAVLLDVTERFDDTVVVPRIRSLDGLR